MANQIPGPQCQETKDVQIDGGTNALTRSPSPTALTGQTEVSFEIGASYMPTPTNLALSHAEMQVLSALRARRSNIIGAERRFRVDRRAIAGAIAWEMLKNVRRWSPRSAGWGKVHLYNYSWKGLVGVMAGAVGVDTIAAETEEAGYLPKKTFPQRKAILETPEGSITYIAAIMAAIADIAGYAGFEDIRSNPIILCNVYQQHTLKSWEEYLRDKPAGSSFAAGNEMAIWVRSHLAFLEEGVGRPDLPESQPGVSRKAD